MVALCDQFAAAWRDGGRPRAEDLAKDHAGDEFDFDDLVSRLLALEIEIRQQRGEKPTAEELHARFPNNGIVIRPALALLESNKSEGTCQTARRPEEPDDVSADGIPTRLGRHRI